MLRYGGRGYRLYSAAINDYIEEATKAWGGPKGFGIALKREFEDAKKGSHQRIRILEMMMQWLKISNDMRPTGEVGDDMNEEEIKAELHQILSEEGYDP